MEKQLSEKLPRIEVVDALRGFAVMAISWYITWNTLSFRFILQVIPAG